MMFSDTNSWILVEMDIRRKLYWIWIWLLKKQGGKSENMWIVGLRLQLYPEHIAFSNELNSFLYEFS